MTSCHGGHIVCRRYPYLIALAVILAAGGRVERAHAQGQSLREMYHAMWTARDGAPQAITELAQHPDGTLWVGSESGLVNFDGQAFRHFQPKPGELALPSGEVQSLLITKAGTIWAGFYGNGVAQIIAGRVTMFSHAGLDPLVSVQEMREAPDGSIWAVDSDRFLLRFDADGKWRREPTTSSSAIGGLFVDSTNTLWLAQDGFLHRRPPLQSSYIRTDIPADVITGVAERPSGDLWFNDYDSATSLGRTQQVSLEGHRLRVLTHSLLTSGRVASMADGSLVFASFAAGLRRLPPQQTSPHESHAASAEPDVFTREQGLSSNATEALLVDAHGNIWVGGARGLDRLRPTYLTSYRAAPEGSRWAVCGSRQGEVWVANTLGELHAVAGVTPVSFSGIDDQLFSLSCADGGRAWFVTVRGVWTVNSGTITALPPILGAAARKQMKVVAASDHTLYATVAGPFEDGSGIWRYRDGTWVKLPREGEQGTGGFATYMDGSDHLWIGSSNGRAIRHSADSATVFPSGEPGLGYVYAFLDSSRGLFAAGTNGLAVLRESRFEMLSFAEPSFASGVRGLIEALNGDLWLNAASGLTRVPVAELESGLSQPTYPMKATRLREGDYAGATQRVLGYLDTTARDSRGRLWFATANGVVHFNPEGAGLSHPPMVSVRSMLADGRAIDNTGIVGPAMRTLEVRYFGANLTAPENVIYRYRLEGFDDAWQESGTRTEAFYTRLAPGTYTFKVMASNGDGVWTAAVSSAPFTVLPAFYQTWWFAAVMIVVVALVASTGHKARVRHLARIMSARFDERLAERTRVARELHDTLLQTVHGSKLVTDRALRDPTDHNQLVRALEQLSVWLGQAAAEGRAALQSLRASTTETNNLGGALRRAIDDCRSTSTAEMPLVVHGRARDLHPAVRDEVYRIGFEAIRNACLHAHANRIEVVLDYGRSLTLRISDDGVGIAPSMIEQGREGHFGLRGMRERAERIGAKLAVTGSSAGTGTVVTLTVPGHIAFR